MGKADVESGREERRGRIGTLWRGRAEEDSRGGYGSEDEGSRRDGPNWEGPAWGGEICEGTGEIRPKGRGQDRVVSERCGAADVVGVGGWERYELLSNTNTGV